MSTQRPRPKVGVEVYLLGDTTRRGRIVATYGNSFKVLVEWNDDSLTEEHTYRLGDVAARRGAALRAVGRWDA